MYQIKIILKLLLFLPEHVGIIAYNRTHNYVCIKVFLYYLIIIP